MGGWVERGEREGAKKGRVCPYITKKATMERTKRQTALTPTPTPHHTGWNVPYTCTHASTLAYSIT